VPTPTLTKATLKAAIDDINDIVTAWDKGDEPTAIHNGVAVKCLPEQVETQFAALISMAATPDVAEDARETVLALDEFAQAFRVWSEQAGIDFDSVKPIGSDEMWSTWTQVNATLKPRPRKLPERFADLDRSQVPLRQQALIYNFRLPNGEPDLTKLKEEKDSPGKHYNPETWKSPSDERREREVADAWGRRDHYYFAGVFAGYLEPESDDAQRGTQQRIAPESIDHLLDIGVSYDQIARMKGVTVAEVKRHAAAVGFSVHLDTTADPTLAAMEAEQERDQQKEEQAELEANSHPEIADRDLRIIACSAEGMNYKQIAAALAGDYPSLSYQTVGKVVREAKAAGAV